MFAGPQKPELLWHEAGRRDTDAVINGRVVGRTAGDLHSHSGTMTHPGAVASSY
jgi:hypothetical protein